MLQKRVMMRIVGLYLTIQSASDHRTNEPTYLLVFLTYRQENKLISKRFYYLSQKIDGLRISFPRNYLPEASLQCLKFSLTDILVNSIFMRYHAFSIQRNLSKRIAHCNFQMRDLPHRDAAGATLTSRGQRLFMFLKTLFI